MGVLALDSLFFSVATSLVAEPSLSRRRLAPLLWVMLRRGVFLAVPLVVLIVTFAPPLLRILVVASLFPGLAALGSAAWRVTGHTGRIAALDGFLLASAIGTAVVFGRAFGVERVALAWLVTSAATGCAAVPTLIRYYQPSTAE